MAIKSKYDFVGGYEEDVPMGTLCMWPIIMFLRERNNGHGEMVISVKAWDRNLTDEDGPYIELMTGMYTDNQPDFTWFTAL